MRMLQSSRGKTLVEETVTRPYTFQSPFVGQDFAAIIIGHDPTLRPEEQMVISRQLVAAGCRYAMGFGVDADSWDTSVDIAFIESDPDLQPPEERFVMTTSHQDDSAEEVAAWLIWNTAFDFFVPSNFLILNVGSSGGLSDVVAEAASKHLLELAAV
jgi:hypothetical protein